MTKNLKDDISSGMILHRIDDIEVLRAFAILFTLFAHLGALFVWGDNFHQFATSHLTFWGGVDLFFVISGFVIARRLFADLASAPSHHAFWRETGAFWIRRLFRILPSAWFWLIAVPVLSVTFNESHVFKTLWLNLEDMITGMLHIANFHHYAQMKGETPMGANSIYWSLSIEEQFYIALPFLILLSRKHIVPVLGVLVLAQFFLFRPQGSLLWELRFDGLLIGVLLALFAKSPLHKVFDPSLLRKRWVAWPLISVLMFGMAALPYSEKMVPFYTGMLALLSAVLVWIGSYGKNYIMKDGGIKKIFMWIGSRSFAIYLLHTPVFHMVREIWFRIEPTGTVFKGSYTIRFAMTAFVLILILAEANYRLLEVPLRRMGKHYAEKFKKRG